MQSVSLTLTRMYPIMVNTRCLLIISRLKEKNVCGNYRREYPYGNIQYQVKAKASFPSQSDTVL